MLTGEGLRELIGYTRLRLGDVVPNRTRWLKSVPSTSLLYPSDSPLTVTKVGVCASEATNKQILRGLYHLSLCSKIRILQETSSFQPKTRGACDPAK